MRVSRNILKTISVSVIFVGVFLQYNVQAAERGDFEPFVPEELSIPGTVKRISDPTGIAPTRKVYSFKIDPGFCNPTEYEPGVDRSDCEFQSVRSQLMEDVWTSELNGAGQPEEAWYGWYTYFPGNFAYGSRQISGGYEFIYWHTGNCPNLSFQNRGGTGDKESDYLMLSLNSYVITDKDNGLFDCPRLQAFKVIQMRKLLSRWARFEMFVRWSAHDEGEIRLFVDGSEVVKYNGPTLNDENAKANFTKFGIYLNNTPDVNLIKPTRLFFSAVRRSSTREGLVLRRN